MALDNQSSHEMIGPMVDLVYSPDDEASSGKGYYLHCYSPDQTSQLFATAEEARVALRTSNVVWEK